jgi:GNAT superfamily N-acetyltransferase
MNTIIIEERKNETTTHYFSLVKHEKEIGRARLIVAKNSLHENPFGLLEDVFVLENFQGKGYGTKILKAVITKAKEIGCYKLIATSRFERELVHGLYEKIGFVHTSKAFRMNL